MGEVVQFRKLAQVTPVAIDRDDEAFHVCWFGRTFYRHEAEWLKAHGIHAMFAPGDEAFYVKRKDLQRAARVLRARINGVVDGDSLETRKAVFERNPNANPDLSIPDEEPLRYMERKDEDEFLAGNPNTYFDVRAFGRKLSEYEARKLRGHRITVLYSCVSDSYHIARSDMEAVLHLLKARLIAVVQTKSALKVTIDVGAFKPGRAN